MFFKTSGNKADTSLPSVMAMMVFWIDSFRSYAYCETRPARSSNVSPFRGAAKAPRMRFTAIVEELYVVGGARGWSWIRRRDATSREGSGHARCRGGSCSGGSKGLMALRRCLPGEPQVAALRIVASSPGKLSFRGGCELQAYGLGHTLILGPLLLLR